ncbi:MAG: hypothetical protein QME68_05665, partial [Elusimicrobiota bacterium]|nr:hypothetical protein [Elusimicrobiota bacterium]
MKKIFYTTILLYTLHFTLHTTFGAFKDNGWGARPVGMGGAFTAVSDDVLAISYNPAGISQIKYFELNAMYAKLYTGLDAVDLGMSYAAFVYPARKIGSFGLNWANFVSAKQYREDTICLAYAKSINEIVKQLFKRRLIPELSLGLNIKYLQHSYILDEHTVNDPVFTQGNSKSNMTVDLGLWSNPIPRQLHGLSVGLMLKNIIQPDVGLKTKDIVP